MKRIQLSRGMVALVDDEDFDYLNQWKWCWSKSRGTYYALRRVGRKGVTHVSMHRLIMGNPEKKMVDHINHDGLDNQRSNLRICSTRENNLNLRGLRANNSSGISGVSFNKSAQKWQAYVSTPKKRVVYLGIFLNKEDAAMAVINYEPE